MQLVKEVYSWSEGFPGAEKFGLTSQMRRAAVSIPSNIAEGAGRGGSREFAQFLSIARGSLSELETHYLLALDLSFARPNPLLLETMDQVSRLLNGLHKRHAGTGKRDEG